MTSEWYYQIMGETIGPVTGAEMKGLLEEGSIALDALVRRGEGNWVFADRVTGLFADDDNSQRVDGDESTAEETDEGFGDDEILGFFDNSPADGESTPETPPTEPSAGGSTRAVLSEIRRRPSHDVIGDLATTASILWLLIVLAAICFTILSAFKMLSSEYYIFNDEDAFGYSANKLREIQMDIVFFKFLVLFVLLDRTFARLCAR